MRDGSGTAGYGLYWRTWGLLLLVTVLMVMVDEAPLARPVIVSLMLAAMLTKAALIAANFMHLRFERLALTVMIVLGLLVNGAILFALIVPDAVRLAATSRP